MRVECWFAQLPGAGPCEGLLRICHLLPAQTLRKEFPHGVVRVDGEWRRAHPIENPAWEHKPVEMLIRDERCWVPGCGGIMGNSGHHGAWQPDGPRKIPREMLPLGLFEFADEIGLPWWIERTYGERTAR